MQCNQSVQITLPITRAIVCRQLVAMGGGFELGILRANGAMLLRDRATERFVIDALAWLRHENACGAHIFVRPAGSSPLTLIDDLGEFGLASMRRAGFEPAVVVETSPGNFQAWLRHERPLDRELATAAARALAERFGGDLSSASWRHFGRLAGFTNQKANRRLRNGLAPFVRLRESRGVIFSEARRFRRETELLVEQTRRQCAARARTESGQARGPGRSLSEFHHDRRYAGDLHRADMAWAAAAAFHGASVAEISAALRAGRDLSKKGGVARQIAYAERTALKAVSNLLAASAPQGEVTCRSTG